ncbi:copper-sensing transcriptional repressor CsoR [Peptococcaceae bacterium CEB3]|nr:copper-sensing transcriptional repressor CsoR [Peptococcaceae bacterium CEB3]
MMNEEGLTLMAECDCSAPGEADGPRKSHHDERTVRDLISRMNRIEGQIRGIKGMIERNVYCDDILNQISSARSALDGVSKLLLEKHMKSCVKERLESGDPKVVDEVLKTVFRMMR